MKTAIIGVGKMGHLRIESILKQSVLKITALCDPILEKSPIESIPLYKEWKNLLDQEKPDVVFVCTYNNAIKDIVCTALEMGCHVFSEKPPGKNLKETLSMQNTSLKASQQILKFGFNHRLHNSIMEAKALVDSGIFGKIVCARGTYGKAGSTDFSQQWRSDKEKAGGGILLDQGIHMLDLLIYFMGELNVKKSLVNNYVWHDIPMEDNVMAILSTKDGRSALFHSSVTQWRHLFRLELICEEGYINMDGLITSTKSYGEERVVFGFKDIKQVTGKLGMPCEQIYYFDTDDSWDLELAEFIDAIRGKRSIQHGTIKDAINVMRLIQEIYTT